MAMRILLALVLALLAVAALLLFRSRPEAAVATQAAQHQEARPAAISNGLGKDASPPAAQREELKQLPAGWPGAAQLVVHVRRKATRAPVADIEVKVFGSGPPTDGSSSMIEISPPVSVGRTDSAGDATFGVPVDDMLMVEAELPERAGKHETALGIAGIPSGGRSEIEILLPDEDDTRVLGQVLAAETNAPLAGARVELRNPEGAADRGRAAYTTGADGRFEIPFSSWAYPHLHVEAEGRGARLANPADHDDPARPLLVRLARMCTLEVDARDPAGAPLSGVQLLLRAKSADLDVVANEASGFFMRAYLYAPEQSWSVETGSDGRATITGLPAGVELHGLVTWQRTRKQMDPESLTLAPGETRRRAVRFAA